MMKYTESDVFVENIPDELRELPHWVLWRQEKRNPTDDRLTKIPYQVNDRQAKSNDATTWNSFRAIHERFLRGGYSGIGFMFAESSEHERITGVDLDGCRNPKTGVITDWALAIADRCDTYSEVSPSGTGIKLFVRGKSPLPNGKKRSVDAQSVSDKEPGIEVYDHRRYFAVTGHVLEQFSPRIESRQPELDALCAKYFPQPAAAAAFGNGHHPVAGVANVIDRARKYLDTMPPAVSGQSGHNTAFRTACVLVKGFGLTPDEAYPLYAGWNQACLPPWSEHEMRHKLSDARRASGESGYLRDVPVHRQNKVRVPNHQPSSQFGVPLALPDDMPAVERFDDSLLLAALRPWICDIAERMQCPPDFPAVASMIALAGILGRKIGIRPKQRDDWLIVPNLWGAVIGRPGLMKTPAIVEPLNVLKRLEIEAKKEYLKALAEHEVAALVAGVKKEEAKKAVRAAIKNDEDAALLAAELLAGESPAPVRKRYLVNDSTVEKLGEILNENPNGVTVFRDELTGLLKSLDRDGQEGSRAFYLEAWNGTGRYTYDRIGRGTIDIEAAIVSIIGGIQPGPLAEYQRSAVRGGSGDDGLMQRFQLAVWPDCPTTWKNVDRWPDTGSKQTAYETYQRLNLLDPLDILAKTDDDGDIPYLRFDAEAQKLFNDWRAKLECRLRTVDEHPAIESHLAKYRSLIPSLALLIHLADSPAGGPVNPQAFEMAIGWGRYLESHARRIYATAANAEIAAARALARKITEGKIEDGFALRDVYRRGWSLLAGRNDVQAAVDVLSDLNWVRADTEPTEGRDRTRHWINPKILECPPRTEPTKPPEAPFVSSVGPSRQVVCQLSTPASAAVPHADDEWGEL